MVFIKRKPAAPVAKQEDKNKPDIVFIAVDKLLPHDMNPNEMDPQTFDALVDEIREQGFDEPCLVRINAERKGYYDIGSGHHRWKAACVLGLPEVPCIVKHWTDAELRISLTKRNVLRGNLNKGKLRTLYEATVKDFKGDVALAQKAMGFQDPKAFNKLIEDAKKTLPPAARKKLEEAKETIKSVDDLSSVLNRIFKESGSDIAKGYMVFSFGGKEHHYFQIDDAGNAALNAIKAACEGGTTPYADVMQRIIRAVASGDVHVEGVPAAKKPSTLKKPSLRK